MKTTTPRILLHVADGTRVPIDPTDVYLLEAEGNETRIRTRAAETHFDVREIGELEEYFAAHGFIRIHRSYVVNPNRIRLIRPRASGGWEVKLDPPVNRILPVSRDRIKQLWQAVGE